MMQASDVVRSLADRVAPVTIRRIGRVAMTSPDAVIVLPDTLVLVTGEGSYILLRYGQEGLTCASGSNLTALWPADDLDDGEVLDVADLPGGPPPAAFPATISRVSASVGVGSYDDVLGLTLRTSTGAELVLTTSHDELEVTTAEEMRRLAEVVAAAEQMSVEHVSVTPGY